MIDKVVLLCLLCLTSADIDKDFCTKNAKKVVKGTKVPDLPAFQNEFSITLEQTNHDNKSLAVVLVDYSEGNNQLHMKILKKYGFVEEWLDVDRNRDLVSIMNEEDPYPGCEYRALNTTFLNKFFKLMRNPGGEITIAPPAAILRIDQVNIDYVGKGKTRAGLPADVWQSCQYTNDSDTTALVTFYFAQKDMKLPLKSGGMVLTAETKLSSTNAKIPSSYRYDYVNMVPLDDTNKLLPQPTMHCDKAPTGNPPITFRGMDRFSFKVQIMTSYDAGAEYSTYHIENLKIEYNSAAKRFMSEELAFQVGDYGLILREVNDFRQGLIYTIDLLNNNCTFKPMFMNSSVVKLNNDGSAIMKTPKEYFQLDREYEYIGQRYHAERGIDCDVYISKSGTGDKQSTVIWYIASYFWKASVMHYSIESRDFLPVSMEIMEQNRLKVYNFYEFSKSLPPNRMDYSMCFDWKDNILVEINMQGNYYSSYQNHADDFIEAFNGELSMSYGGDISLSRIIVREVNPTGSRSMVVTFTILGLPIMLGNAQVDAPQWTSKEIYANITKYVNAGKMSFRVRGGGDEVYGDVKAISINIADDGKFPLPTPSPSSGNTDYTHGTSHVTHGGTTDHTHGTSHVTRGGKTDHTHGPSHVTHGRKTDHTQGTGHGTNSGQGSTSKNTGFSPGEMAGLAFGCIAIGVLFFVAAFFVYRRFNGRFRRGNHDGGMMELSTQR